MDRFSKLMLWVTSLLVCWLGAASIYGSADGQIRQLEQRSPATLPKLSIDSWLSGQYALGVESWLSDRVVLRQSALDAQEWIRSLRGPNLQNERIVALGHGNPYAMESDTKSLSETAPLPLFDDDAVAQSLGASEENFVAEDPNADRPVETAASTSQEGVISSLGESSPMARKPKPPKGQRKARTSEMKPQKG